MPSPAVQLQVLSLTAPSWGCPPACLCHISTYHQCGMSPYGRNGKYRWDHIDMYIRPAPMSAPKKGKNVGTQE